MTLTFSMDYSKDEDKQKTKDRRDDFTFPIFHFPFITSNIPAWPARVCAPNSQPLLIYS